MAQWHQRRPGNNELDNHSKKQIDTRLSKVQSGIVLYLTIADMHAVSEDDDIKNWQRMNKIDVELKKAILKVEGFKNTHNLTNPSISPDAIMSCVGWKQTSVTTASNLIGFGCFNS